jgi:hypothetical protein
MCDHLAGRMQLGKMMFVKKEEKETIERTLSLEASSLESAVLFSRSVS